MKQILYSVEFVLKAQDLSIEVLRDSLKDLGEDLCIDKQLDNANNAGGFKIQIQTEQPHSVFDTCSLFGRLSCIKVNEL